VIALAKDRAGALPKSRTRIDFLEPPFERKFLVTEDQARGVIAWAARHLRPDPHAAPCSGGAYRVTSLYLDPADLAVYDRRGLEVPFGAGGLRPGCRELGAIR
jgi:hypothetical protein